MSGTIARPAAGGPPGESRSDAGPAQEERRKGWLTPVSVAIGACTLLALALPQARHGGITVSMQMSDSLRLDLVVSNAKVERRRNITIRP